jgi:transcriptional regulator with XRE-family HTH domain
VKADENKHQDISEPVNLSEYVRRERERCNLSLRELARRVGIQASYLHGLEAGRFRQPSPEVIQRIARALDIRYSDLFALTGYRIPEELPDFVPYLRSKYPGLSEDAIRHINEYFTAFKSKDGTT